MSRSCSHTGRRTALLDHLQPNHDQPRLDGCPDVAERHAERSVPELRSNCANHLHSRAYAECPLCGPLPNSVPSPQIMDILVYPGLRRLGFIPRPIFRIWLGFMFGAAAMVYSAVLQVRSRPSRNSTPLINSRVSLTALYIHHESVRRFRDGLRGCRRELHPVDDQCVGPGPPVRSNRHQRDFREHHRVRCGSGFHPHFSADGEFPRRLEYAYNKAPKRMKSLVMAAFLFMTAIGNVRRFAAVLSPGSRAPLPPAGDQRRPCVRVSFSPLSPSPGCTDARAAPSRWTPSWWGTTPESRSRRSSRGASSTRSSTSAIASVSVPAVLRAPRTACSPARLRRGGRERDRQGPPRERRHAHARRVSGPAGGVLGRAGRVMFVSRVWLATCCDAGGANLRRAWFADLRCSCVRTAGRWWRRQSIVRESGGRFPRCVGGCWRRLATRVNPLLKRLPYVITVLLAQQ